MNLENISNLAERYMEKVESVGYNAEELLEEIGEQMSTEKEIEGFLAVYAAEAIKSCRAANIPVDYFCDELALNS